MRDLEQLQTLDYRLWLQEEFLKRRRKNSHYSLRSFANFLQMDASSVSQLLSGKRKASKKLILRLIKKLGASPQIQQALLSSFSSSENESQNKEPENYYQLSLDAFSVVSDWYHYAILEMTFVDGFENDPRWIAQQLDISVTEVQLAIERLKRLELLEEKNGSLFKTQTFLTNFSEGLTSSALKNLQKHVLNMALEAIENTPQEEKDITSMTMAIDVEKIPEAKEKIKEFRRSLCSFLEAGKRVRVYHLGIQLYPISKNNKENIK